MTVAKAKSNTNRWPSKIPFRFDSSLTSGMKDEIRAAIAEYERLTQARFDQRPFSDGPAGLITFERDEEIIGGGESGVGRSAGGVTLKLRESAGRGSTLHEIGHALGLHHEHKRPDRDSFITVIPEKQIRSKARGNYYPKLSGSNCVLHGSYDYGSIMHYPRHAGFSKNGQDEIQSPQDIGQRSSLSPRDLAIVRRLLPSNAAVRTLNGNGTLGEETTRYDWSEGWSIIRSYRVLLTDYLFALNTGNGIIHIHRMDSGGIVGPRIQRRNWKSGWTVAEFFHNGPDTFLFLLKTATGQMQIRRIDHHGKIADKVDERNWTSGWTAAAFYTVLGTDFGLFMKRSDGTIHIHKMSGGKVRERVSDHELPRGNWNIALHFNQNLGVDNRMFFLRNNGVGRVQEITWEGKLGNVIKRYDWSSGWTTGLIYERDFFTKYLFLLKRSNGVVHIHRINGSGKIGARVDDHNWSGGWSSATVINNGHLMLIRESGKTAVI